MTAVSSYLGPGGIDLLSRELRIVDSNFQSKKFVRLANLGLQNLSLFGRADHIARVLYSVLGRPYSQVVKVIVEAAGEPRTAAGYGPMENFRFLAYTRLVSIAGRSHFLESMWALKELTKRFTSEFDVRPFLIEAESITLETFRTWIKDEDFHVRRLVSEGTRSRLPWGVHIRSFRQNPSKIGSLLEHLKADESPYVRLSVANNLADIIKDDPDYGIGLAERWAEAGHPLTAKVVHHAVRLPARRGNKRALALRIKRD